MPHSKKRANSLEFYNFLRLILFEILNLHFIHLFTYFSAVKVTVLLGVHDITTREPTLLQIKSRDFIIHENYNTKNYDNDIAFVKLPSPIKLTNAIKIVKVATGSNTYQGSTGNYRTI